MFKLVTPNSPDGFKFDSLVDLLYFVMRSHEVSFIKFVNQYKNDLMWYLPDIIK